MISVNDAISRILAVTSTVDVEKVGILESLGRVLGEDIYARRHLPPKDNSAMDGFAVKSEDTRAASEANPVTLKIIEDIPAGHIPRKTINTGEAARIMTGAPVPAGADAVIRKEDAHVEGNQAYIYAEVKSGHDIRRAGEDVQAGELVISRGEVIRPAELGMLASLGYSLVYVYQRPLVAIVATGNELVDLDQTPSDFSIVTSNSYSLAAQVMDCGAIPLQLGIARDTTESVLNKFHAACRADVIVSSGGVSVGDYDLVKKVMSEAGNHMQFWQVAMKPGKPFAFGYLKDKPLFGLPGNPVSSMVSFEQLVRPALLKMMGHKKLFRATIHATLEDELKKKSGIKHFIRAHVTLTQGSYTARTTGEQGSGILKSMVKANGLIIFPEEATLLKKGDLVTVQLIDNSLIQTEELINTGFL